jgi:hypothetical protein
MKTLITLNVMHRRTMFTLTTLAFLCLGIALPASDAVGQQKTLKELIVGTWLLDSVYDQAQDGTKRRTCGVPMSKGSSCSMAMADFLSRSYPLTVQNPRPTILGIQLG